MRDPRSIVVVLCALVLMCWCAPGAGAQSLGPGTRDPIDSDIRPIDPNNFRCIFLGDSQISAPATTRIRVQMRRWDIPVAGAVFAFDFSSAGQDVEYNIDGVDYIRSRIIGNPGGWSGGGPRDFMNYRGYEWLFVQDVEDTRICLARFRLYNAFGNTVPWRTNWITTGDPLVVRIALRTTPNTVPLIETRALRGQVDDEANKVIHTLNQDYGYQIIEQPLDPSFFPTTDGVGVAFYLPEGSVESYGDTLQVLSVAVMRTDRDGNLLPGMVVGAQAYPGWSIDNHLDLTDASREALIDLIDANALMVMLGHNTEPAGSDVDAMYLDLIGRWMDAFNSTGRPRPSNIHVVPWMIGVDNAGVRLRDMLDAMSDAAEVYKGAVVSLLGHFHGVTPSEYDPARYQLDGLQVHPLNSSTARNLSEDLEALIFSNPRIVRPTDNPARYMNEPASEPAQHDWREGTTSP